MLFHVYVYAMNSSEQPQYDIIVCSFVYILLAFVTGLPPILSSIYFFQVNIFFSDGEQTYFFLVSVFKWHCTSVSNSLYQNMKAEEMNRFKLDTYFISNITQQFSTIKCKPITVWVVWVSLEEGLQSAPSWNPLLDKKISISWELNFMNSTNNSDSSQELILYKKFNKWEK